MHIFCMIFMAIVCNKVNSQSIQDQEARGVHIVHGADPHKEVHIVWWTKVPVALSTVHYALLSHAHDDLPNESLLCENNQSVKGYIIRNATHGKYIQRVILGNLLPNRRYCYEITSGQSSSHIYSFRTSSFTLDLSVQDPANFHSNFIVYGVDIQPSLATSAQTLQNPLLTRIIQSLKDQMSNKDLHGFINLPLIHLKEYSNNLNNLNTDDFLDFYGEILPNMQILPTIGQLGDSSAQNLFRHMFPLMGRSPFNSYYYSVDSNGVHFLSYSADLFTYGQLDQSVQMDQSTVEIIEAQIDSIERDLIRANRNRNLCPWIVVVVAQSMHCMDAACDSNVNDVLKKRVEKLFDEYKVDLVFESASNEYERSYPSVRAMQKYKANYERADMPVVISMPKYSVGASRKNTDKWSAFRYKPVDDTTYGLFEVINSSYIKWTFMYANQTLIDEFSLFKDHEKIITKSFLEKLDSMSKLNNYNKNNNKVSSSLKSHSSLKLFISFMLLIVFLTSICYFLIKRHLNLKRARKLNTNYTNLIESEFDT